MTGTGINSSFNHSGSTCSVDTTHTNTSNNSNFSKRKPVIDFAAKYSKHLSKHDHLKVLFPFWEQENLPANLKQKSDMIALGSGTPNEVLFPFEKIQISLKQSPRDTETSVVTSITMNDETHGKGGVCVTPTTSNSLAYALGREPGSLDSDLKQTTTTSTTTTTTTTSSSSTTTPELFGSSAASSVVSSSLFECDDNIDSSESDEDFEHLSKHPRRLSIRECLQYGDTCFGNFKTLDMIKSLLIKFKNIPPYANWDYLVTSGTSTSCFKICQLLVDEDTTVLVEEFTYSVILSNIKFANGNWIPLKLQFDTENVDNQGIDVEYFTELLENWEIKNPNKQKPKLLYTIPTGQNPTGMTVSMEKRKRIYELCCKHDIIIMEDDPYGYLKFPKYDKENPTYNPYKSSSSESSAEWTIGHYINKTLMPSYITLDIEGRVLRCETFSKICAPGLRLGFVVGNQYLIKKLMNVIDVSTREPSGLSQGALLNGMIAMDEKYSATLKKNALMSGNWKNHNQVAKTMSPLDGWAHWCMNIAGEYLHRRNLVLTELYSSKAFHENQFSVLEPSAGMFASVVINLKPQWKKGLEIKKAMDYLNYCLLEEGCDCILGYKMTVDEKLSLERSNFLRITFAQASNDQVLIEACKRIAKAVTRLFDEYQTDKQKFRVLEYA